MNVLVVGSGGREHAICHAIVKSPRLGRLFILPGNPGTAALGTNIRGSVDDTSLVLDVVQREAIDLVVIGPEDPLAAGMADALQRAGVRVFGPSAEAARLEADKAFAKQLMRQYAIPTADSRTFADFDSAQQYIATRDEPVVVKASGLAKGKGVIVCDDPADAILAAEKILVKRVFGDAGSTIVVEERLLGREASLLAIVDGHTSYLLEPAQDHKRIGEGDTGLNTGGMGSYCPTPAMTDELIAVVQSQILVPTLDALVRQEIHYRGVLYMGLMLTTAGPKVLEYNCRFGDPEAQAILPRIRSDFLELLWATVNGELDQAEVRWDPRHALCVVMASPGYPDKSTSGIAIRNVPEPTDDAVVFHAGTAMKGGRLVSAGGRVLGVTGLGDDLQQARQRAYAVVDQIDFEGAQVRRDLGNAASVGP